MTNLLNLSQIQARLSEPSTLTFDETSIGVFRRNLSSLKESAVKVNDQKAAKDIWCAETILAIQEHYVSAFSQLKSADYYKGWCTLEKAEIELSFLSSHRDMLRVDYYLEFIDRHVKRWQSLFPYRLFISPELLETEKKCSICNQIVSPRKPCGHEVGEIYNGEICLRIVSGLEFLGMAVVTKPLQKYSVLFLSDEESEKREDHYDYAVVKWVIERLQSPWHGWSAHLTRKIHPHRKFVGISQDNLCPCNSGEKYGVCCLRKAGVEMPHYEFAFEVAPPEGLQNEELHY